MQMLDQFSTQINTQALESVSAVTGTLAAMGYLGTAGLGAGELYTDGADTPGTIGLWAFSRTATGITFGAGLLETGLNAFASSGNPNYLANCDTTHLEGLAAQLISSDIPAISSLGDTIGEFATQIAELSQQAQEACK